MELQLSHPRNKQSTLKFQLIANLTEEFRENGLNDDDMINKDTWFLRDLIKVYASPRGDVGATMTPGENMNLQAQIFFQLQKNGSVPVRQYIEELAMVLIENYEYLSNFKQAQSKIKQEKMAITQFQDSLNDPKLKRPNIFESKLGIKLSSNQVDTDFFQQGDEKYVLEAKVDSDTPVVISEFNINDSILSDDNEFKNLTMLYSSDFIFFNIRRQRKVEASAKIDLKLLYDQVSVSQLQHPSGVSMNYILQFYDNLDKLKNSDYEPQSNKSGCVFELEIKMRITMDVQTLKQIAEAKDHQLTKKESEFKFKKERHVGLIEDALFPFTNVKYSYDRGFYRKDNKNSLYYKDQEAYHDIAFEKESDKEKCRVCESCYIF